jgi:hypothetical protein
MYDSLRQVYLDSRQGGDANQLSAGYLGKQLTANILLVIVFGIADSMCSFSLLISSRHATAEGFDGRAELNNLTRLSISVSRISSSSKNHLNVAVNG